MPPIQHFLYMAPVVVGGGSTDTYQDVPFDIAFDTNHVTTSGHAHQADSFLNLAGSGADYYEVEVEVVVMQVTRPYILLRLENNSANYIEINASNGSQLSVRRYAGGSLVENVSNLAVFAAGQRYKYQVYSDRMEFYLDDTLIYTYTYGTDYAQASAYRPKIYANTTGNTTFKINFSRYVTAGS